MELFSVRTKPQATLTYRSVGSAAGQVEFLGNASSTPPYATPFSAFGSGDTPLTTSQYQSLTVTGGQAMIHVPYLLNKIGLFHNLPGLTQVGICHMTNVQGCWS